MGIADSVLGKTARKACPAGKPSDGFTLVELLVVITIMTLLMTVAFGSLRLGGRSLESGRNQADGSEEIRSVGGFLRRQFAQLATVAREEKPRYSLNGDATQVRFVAPAPVRSAGVGLIVYELAGNRRSGRLDLVILYGVFDPGLIDAPDLPAQGSRVLVEDLQDLSFQFYGAIAGSEDDPTWHEAWDGGEDGLPELVRLAITPRTGTPWPELIFRVRPEVPS